MLTVIPTPRSRSRVQLQQMGKTPCSEGQIASTLIPRSANNGTRTGAERRRGSTDTYSMCRMPLIQSHELRWSMCHPDQSKLTQVHQQPQCLCLSSAGSYSAIRHMYMAQGFEDPTQCTSITAGIERFVKCQIKVKGLLPSNTAHFR